MGIHDSFISYLKDQFSHLGPIHVRKMFGGAGIYLEGVMFGLVDEDTVYLKVSDFNRQDFEDEGMGPFIYEGKNKPISMSYYQLPEEVLEDPDALFEWGSKALQVALSGKK